MHEEVRRRYGTVLVGSRAMREEYLRHGLARSQVTCVPLFGDGTPEDKELVHRLYGIVNVGPPLKL